MGGSEIELDSEPGKGSVFSFTCPFDIIELEDKVDKNAVQVIQGLNVLIVEDNQSSLLMISRMLENFQIPHVGVRSAEEAFELLIKSQNEIQISMIIMDWKLPGADGIEASRKIASHHNLKKIPIIMISAYGREKVISDAEAAGVRDFLFKPVKQSALLDAIMEAVGLESRMNRRSYKSDKYASFDGYKILLAEDNSANRLVAVEMLSQSGFKVDTAQNGEEAVQAVQNEDYCLVLMDVQMPRMDGLEATRQIKKLEGVKQIPIIAMTANAMAGDREECLAAGMNDYISKPINRLQLINTLDKWIRRDPKKEKLIMTQQDLSNMTLPDLHGINVHDGLERQGLNWQAFQKMLVVFPDDQRGIVKILSKAVEKNDLDQIKFHAHSLVGAAGTISAYGLVSALRELEKAARDNDIKHIVTLFKQVKKSYEIVCNSIMSLDENQSVAQDKKQKERVPVKAILTLLEKLNHFLEDFDPSGSIDCMEELNRFMIPPAIQTEMIQLNKHIDDFQYEKANEILEKIKEILKSGEVS